MDDNQLNPLPIDGDETPDDASHIANDQILNEDVEMKGQDTLHNEQTSKPTFLGGSPLPNDIETPFSPEVSPQDDRAEGNLAREIDMAHLDDTHPATDSGIDKMETYDEGVSGSAEATEPNAGNAVVDYEKTDKEKDNG